MTADDSQLLRLLCESFENSVVFEEAWPSSFSLAKMFPAMQRSHGGLLLLGVREDKTVVGVPGSEVGRCRERIEHLCAELLDFTTEVGVIRVADRNVIFVLFNLIAAHRRILEPVEPLIHQRSYP